MTEKEKRSLKIRLGKRLSQDKSRIMEIIKEEIDKTETTMEQLHGEWIDVPKYKGFYVCSKCLERVGGDFEKIEYWNCKLIKDDFCSNCGSDNRKRDEENG